MIAIPSPATYVGMCKDTVNSVQVKASRRAITNILKGKDDRLLLITGPCSAHDPEAMVEYARELSAVADEHRDQLYVIVRAYSEKPRTRHGWPGMLLDPHLDDSYDVVEGIKRTQHMLAEIAKIGLAIATEFVDPMLTPFIGDYISWACVGARTVESPVHRRMASTLPMPVGIKNRVDGAVGPAVDAIAVANRPQPIVEITKDGTLSSFMSDGNENAHLVLRGGEAGTNYHAHQVNHALRSLAGIQQSPSLVIDCSHGNSGKDHRRQPVVARAVGEQIATGQQGIAGVMLESFINEGQQAISPDQRYGVSVTDACLNLDQTALVASELARATAMRRERVKDSRLVNAV